MTDTKYDGGTYRIIFLDTGMGFMSICAWPTEPYFSFLLKVTTFTNSGSQKSKGQGHIFYY